MEMKNQDRSMIRIGILLSLFVVTDCRVSLTLCDDPVEGHLCTLSCVTPALDENIIFKRNNIEYARCFYLIGIPSICVSSGGPEYKIIQTGIDTTRLIISNISVSRDAGVWACEYGQVDGDSKSLMIHLVQIQASLDLLIKNLFRAKSQTTAVLTQ